jgi:Collagenase and related proteases
VKIVAPLSNINCYEPLVEAGAGEFFCGFLPFDWLKKYKAIIPINRRENLAAKSNICTWSSMKILGRMVEKYKIPVKITFNSHYYINNQYKELAELIKALMYLGFSTFIIADIGLAIYLRDNNIDCGIHLSGESEIVNSMAMCYMEQFNISRFIFPRKTTLSDMRDSIKNSGIQGKEYEAFILNSLCPFSGAFCNSIHNDLVIPACHIPHRIVRVNNDARKFSRIDSFLKIAGRVRNNNLPDKSEDTLFGESTSNYKFGQQGCGVCRMMELKSAGITHLKVVGRGVGIENLVEDVKNLRDIIKQTETGADENFKDTVKERYFGKNCPKACYYPIGLQ